MITIDIRALAAAVADELERRGLAPSQPSRRLLSPREAAHALGISPSKLYSLIRDGLPTIPVGVAQQRIDLDEVVAWLRSPENRSLSGADENRADESPSVSAISSEKPARAAGLSTHRPRRAA